MSASKLDIQNIALRMQAQNAQEAQARISRLKGPEPGPDAARPVDKDKKLRAACEGFESIFIQKMWEQMRATVPKTGLTQSREEHFWQGMFDQELSKKMASAGGIGLADMMYEQLSRNLVSATQATASSIGARRGGFAATAAPLVPEPTPTPDAATPVGTDDIYAGAAAQPEAPHAPEEARSEDALRTTPKNAAAGSADEETPPVVRDVLAELRRRQNSGSPQGDTTTIHARSQGLTTTRQMRQAAAAPAGETGQGVQPGVQPASQPVPQPAPPPLPPQFVIERNQTAASVFPARAAETPQEQGGRIINSTFTTNIPPKTRKSGPRRPPSGQTRVRVLSAVPTAGDAQKHAPAGERTEARKGPERTGSGSSEAGQG